MILLAFSDLHRDLALAEKIVANCDRADVLVGAGDFGTCGEGALEVLDILKRANKPSVLVAGNHDCLSELSTYCENWTNGYLLHGNGVTLDNQEFWGLGGEIPTVSNHEWNFSLSEVEASMTSQSCPTGAVLITHTPPFGHADMQSSGLHAGSTAITNAIVSKSQRLALCGHIHNAWGMRSMVGTTEVVNLGPTANWFTLR